MSHTYGSKLGDQTNHRFGRHSHHTYHFESLSDPSWRAVIFRSFTCSKENAKKKHIRTSSSNIPEKENKKTTPPFWGSRIAGIVRCFFRSKPSRDWIDSPSHHCWVESHAVAWQLRFPRLLPNNPQHCMQPRHGNTLPSWIWVWVAVGWLVGIEDITSRGIIDLNQRLMEMGMRSEFDVTVET